MDINKLVIAYLVVTTWFALDALAIETEAGTVSGPEVKVDVELQSQVSVDIGRSEYEILSEVLKHGFGTGVANVIIDQSSTGDPVTIAAPNVTPQQRADDLGVDVRVLVDWGLKNQDKYRFDNNFDLPMPYSLLSSAGRFEVFGDNAPADGWKQFFNRFPDAPGIVRLSRAGLDLDQTRSLVYIEFQCGANCGSGRLVQLQRGPGSGWSVQSGELIWITTP